MHYRPGTRMCRMRSTVYKKHSWLVVWGKRLEGVSPCPNIHRERCASRWYQYFIEASIDAFFPIDFPYLFLLLLRLVPCCWGDTHSVAERKWSDRHQQKTPIQLVDGGCAARYLCSGRTIEKRRRWARE